MTVERNYWLAIANATNCVILARMQFPFYALSRVSRIAMTIKPHDLCALYRAGEKKGFIGLFEVTEPVKEIPTYLGIRVFSMRLPWRQLALCEDAPVELKNLAPDLAFIKNKRHFGIYFQTNVKRLSESDFQIIERAVNASMKALRSG